MAKWKVETIDGSVVVEAAEVVDSDAWVDFIRYRKQGTKPPTLLVRRFRRQDVHGVTLEED